MVEKPLECNQCKKSADVIYNEIIGKKSTITHMCRDCPILKQKLYGKLPTESQLSKENETYCSQCQTTLEAVQMGEPLGCQECYTVFEDILFDQLKEIELISPRLKLNPIFPMQSLHIGKTPQYGKKAKQALRFHDLNEALKEALKKENYEEAAWIRDQISSLTQEGFAE